MSHKKAQKAQKRRKPLGLSLNFEIGQNHFCVFVPFCG
jgi:hypothetical protein